MSSRKMDSKKKVWRKQWTFPREMPTWQGIIESQREISLSNPWTTGADNGSGIVSTHTLWFVVFKKLLEGTTPEPRKISALMVKKINDELTSIAALGEPTKGNP